MNQTEFKKDISDLFIFDIMEKVRADYSKGDKVPKVWYTDLHVDSMMTRMRRHGIFGWCESELRDKEYSTHVEWHMKVYQLTQIDMLKLIGAIEYRLIEILEGRVKFLLTKEKALAIKKKYNDQGEGYFIDSGINEIPLDQVITKSSHD